MESDSRTVARSVLLVWMRAIRHNLRLLHFRWVASHRDPKTRWRDGVESEIEYWRHYFKTKGDQWPDDYKAKLDPNGTMLEDLIVRHLPQQQDRVRILDVGSGPVSSLGFPRSPNGQSIELTAADPLADRYNKLLQEYGIQPATWPVPVAAEGLSARFKDGEFDLVHMRNASDHSIDPVVSLQQMVHVVRPGGYVVLKHYPDEAEGAAYTGLHSWNLNERKGRFIIWQRPGPEIDVGQALGETAEVKAWRDTQWIYAAIKRTR